MVRVSKNENEKKVGLQGEVFKFSTMCDLLPRKNHAVSTAPSSVSESHCSSVGVGRPKLVSSVNLQHMFTVVISSDSGPTVGFELDSYPSPPLNGYSGLAWLEVRI